MHYPKNSFTPSAGPGGFHSLKSDNTGRPAYHIHQSPETREPGICQVRVNVFQGKPDQKEWRSKQANDPKSFVFHIQQVVIKQECQVIPARGNS